MAAGSRLGKSWKEKEKNAVAVAFQFLKIMKIPIIRWASSSAFGVARFIKKMMMPSFWSCSKDNILT